MKYLFGKNAFIPELLRTGIFNSKNIDFKLNINANKIQNKRDFVNLFLKEFSIFFKLQNKFILLLESRVK